MQFCFFFTYKLEIKTDQSSVVGECQRVANICSQSGVLLLIDNSQMWSKAEGIVLK